MTAFSILFLITLGTTMDGAVSESPPAPIVPISSLKFEMFDSRVKRRGIQDDLKIGYQLDDGPWQTQNAVYPLAGQNIKLRIQNKNVTQLRWYLIFADLTRTYQNANPPGQANAYKWRKMDFIQYYRVEIEDAREQPEILPKDHIPAITSAIAAKMLHSSTNPWAQNFYQPGLGTFWFQAEGEIHGVPHRTPGLDDVADRGISPNVFRMSIRQTDDYLGWITSFYNIPSVFGSVLYQSQNYIGADCADVLMSAWSKWKRKKMRTNYNVQRLLTRFPKQIEIDINHGTPSSTVEWNRHITQGDLIAVRYSGEGKKFQHVGALMGDTNKNGILDSEDLVIHAGPYPLHVTPISSGAFNGHVVVLRP